MPTYRVELTTGKVLEVPAHRMVARAELTTFANIRRGAWVAELKIPNGERSQTGSFLSR